MKTKTKKLTTVKPSSTPRLGWTARTWAIIKRQFGTGATPIFKRVEELAGEEGDPRFVLLIALDYYGHLPEHERAFATHEYFGRDGEWEKQVRQNEIVAAFPDAQKVFAEPPNPRIIQRTPASDFVDHAAVICHVLDYLGKHVAMWESMLPPDVRDEATLQGEVGKIIAEITKLSGGLMMSGELSKGYWIRQLKVTEPRQSFWTLNQMARACEGALKFR